MSTLVLVEGALVILIFSIFGPKDPRLLMTVEVSSSAATEGGQRPEVMTSANRFRWALIICY